MYYSDDPIADFERYDEDVQIRLDKLPKCEECHNPIQDEEAYYINGCWICEDCMSSYKREVQPEY